MIDKIKAIIANHLRIDVNTIDDDASILEDLGADSLDIVEMMMAIEEDFGISIPDEDVVGLKTIKDIADYVERSV